MSNKFKTDHLAGELRRFRRGVELQRAAELPAWRAPWPAQPPRKAAAKSEAEADDLVLRAAQAALRRGDVP